MGMYDSLTSEYELPMGEGDLIVETSLPKNINARVYQTKDTPTQALDHYKINSDGLLLHEAYDIEDRSDPKATGLNRFIGCMTRVNKRWEPSTFTGRILFYDFYDDLNSEGWIEYEATFLEGMLKKIELKQLRKET